jgi:hypothetical protein
MNDTASSQLASLVHFMKSFHLYSRYQISKTAKSTLKYGEGFGDAKVLKLAKEDFLRKEVDYKNRDEVYKPESGDKIVSDRMSSPYGGIYAFRDENTPEVSPDGLQIEITASKKKLEDFLGKDYVVDISPESLFIIFPDLTFQIEIRFLIDISWGEVRAELQEADLLDKDIAHLSGEAVSLDELRKKLKDTTSTDGTLIDLRKKFYGIAYAINESFQNQVKQYDK